MIKLLIVDDEEYIREVLELNFKDGEYEVLTASDGEEALKIARKEKPDIIVSDIIMPVMDGIELCREIKSDKELKEIYFIILTAKIKLDDKIKGLESGADDYITKPFKLKEVVARVKVGKRVVEYMKKNKELIGNLKRQNIELQEMQNKLINLEKLSTIGQTTSSIVHELKNPITAIKSDLWYIRNNMIEKDLINKVKKAENELNDIIDIINNLLSFCKIKKPDIKENKLLPIISSAVISNKFPAGVILENKVNPDITVKSDSIQLKIVITNLIKNSIEAYNEYGTQGRIIITAEKKDEFVTMSIKDFAGGIKHENIKNIFDFFYTTKEHGVGIGLAFAKYIIESHKGKIEVKSKDNRTIISIILPS